MSREKEEETSVYSYNKTKCPRRDDSFESVNEIL